jgi:hypothetical protein
LPKKIRDYIERKRYPEMDPKNAYLRMFDQTQTLFIHIPKTAGTSVSQAIYGEQPWHHSISTYHKLNSNKAKTYFKFAFVRNPFDRLYSTYCYAKKISHQIYRGPLSEIAALDSFEDFVLNWCTEEKINEHFFLKPQFYYLSIDGETLYIDFIGYFENINEDFNKLSKHLQIDQQLPVTNKSTAKVGLNEAYNPDMLAKVSKLYAIDFLHFNYSPSE